MNLKSFFCDLRQINISAFETPRLSACKHFGMMVSVFFAAGICQMGAEVTSWL